HLRHVQVSARDPTNEPLAEAIRSHCLDSETPSLEQVVWRTREPEVLRVTPDFLRGLSSNAEQLAMLQALRARSVISAPFVRSGKLTGMLITISSTRSYDQDDVQLLVQVAERAAMALESASLHSALNRANGELRHKLTELQQARRTIRTLTGLLPV